MPDAPLGKARLRCGDIDPAEGAAALGPPPAGALTGGEPAVRGGRVLRDAQ